MTTTNDSISLAEAQLMERISLVFEKVGGPLSYFGIADYIEDVDADDVANAAAILTVLGYIEPTRGVVWHHLAEPFRVATDYVGGPWPSTITPTPAERRRDAPCTFIPTKAFVDALNDAERSAYDAGRLKLIDIEHDGIRVVPITRR